MTTSPDTTLAAIAAYLAAQDDLRLGIVFGSVARQRATARSDLDLAVLAERPLTAERRMELIGELARLTGRAVDLVDLATAGIPVARSALLTGRVLLQRDTATYPAQVSRILIDSADFLPYRNRLLRERREAWTR
ncbi:MAG: nucleotidyltransferase domain-containing protein [Pseudomonadales bacterium]|nr:nucleotidyltransferase domain-containing protein [Pseudomonadales bacterium]